MPSHIESSILDVKYHHPSWGAKKIKNWLIQERGDVLWPAKSTIDDLLKRHSLVTPAKRKRSVAPYTNPFVLCSQPNDSWSIDYKGQFLLESHGVTHFCTNDELHQTRIAWQRN